MNPQEIDDIIAKIKASSGATHVEITLTWPNWQTATHEIGALPDPSAGPADQEWSNVKRMARSHKVRRMTNEAG